MNRQLRDALILGVWTKALENTEPKTVTNELPWLPIKTAPKDGTPILVRRKPEKGYEHLRFGVDWWCFGAFGMAPCWYKSRQNMQPTHYVLLSEPSSCNDAASRIDHRCEICGEPMPPGEEMFKFHGFSGNCPIEGDVMGDYKLVPVEPTDEMLEAAQVAAMDLHTGFYDIRKAYAAMIATAPSPPLGES